jgi:hypothetical protein
MSEELERLKERANPAQRRAIETLEMRGFVFCAHFGVDNAIAIRDDMDRAMKQGRLYEYLRLQLGVVGDEED